MSTTGHIHRLSPEAPAIRSSRRWTIVATMAGVLVLAAVMGLNLDAVPELPAKVTLGVSIAAFYGAAFCAIRPPERRMPAIRSTRRPAPAPADPPPAADADDLRRPSEDERVSAWRRTRLTALGVPEEMALVLAEDPSFSTHELERLLDRGCPLGTALRILQPA